MSGMIWVALHAVRTAESPLVYLVDELVEGVLSVRARLSEPDLSCLEGQHGAILRHALPVALHIHLQTERISRSVSKISLNTTTTFTNPNSVCLVCGSVQC